MVIKEKNKLVKDFLVKYWYVLLCDIIIFSLQNIVDIYLVSKLGVYMDAALKRDFYLLKNNIINLLFILCIVIFVLPCISSIYRALLFGKVVVLHDTNIYKKFLCQKLLKLSKLTVGEVLTRFNDDIRLFRFAILDVVEILFSCIFILYVLYVMIKIEIFYSILSFILVLLPIIVPLITKKQNQRITKYGQVRKDELRELENQVVQSFMYIKVHSLEKEIEEMIKKCYQDFIEKYVKEKIKTSVILKTMDDTFSQISMLFMYILGSYFMLRNKISLGDFIKIAGYSILIKGMINYIINTINQFYKLKIFSKRILDLINSPERYGGKVLTKDIEIVEIKNIGYRFDKDYIFKNISLDIKKGDKVAIIGENGSGKTTFLKILLGFYEDYEGEIYINGIELKEINLESLRESIGYCSQQPFIFNFSVEDNIKMVKFNKEINTLESVMKKLMLEEIKDKRAGDNGIYLSGGQKQRISLRRAMLKGRQFYLFDEVTANLDEEGKKVISSLLEDPNTTIIMVTHERDLLRYFNKIYQIDFN